VTAFFGSGLLFVGLLVATAAVISTPTAIVQFLEEPALSSEGVSLLRGLGFRPLPSDTGARIERRHGPTGPWKRRIP
jgi:hypothetical protein